METGFSHVISHRLPYGFREVGLLPFLCPEL